MVKVHIFIPKFTEEGARGPKDWEIFLKKEKKIVVHLAENHFAKKTLAEMGGHPPLDGKSPNIS